MVLRNAIIFERFFYNQNFNSKFLCERDLITFYYFNHSFLNFYVLVSFIIYSKLSLNKI